MNKDQVPYPSDEWATSTSTPGKSGCDTKCLNCGANGKQDCWGGPVDDDAYEGGLGPR